MDEQRQADERRQVDERRRADGRPAPLARKLGVRAGTRLLLLDSPVGWSLPEVPPDVIVERRDALPPPGAAADAVAVVFARDAAGLAARADALAAAVYPNGTLWVCWPRRAARHVSDLSDVVLRSLLLPTGLVDTKVAMIDVDWSGLRFVWRVPLRAAAAHPSPVVVRPRRAG